MGAKNKQTVMILERVSFFLLEICQMFFVFLLMMMMMTWDGVFLFCLFVFWNYGMFGMLLLFSTKSWMRGVSSSLLPPPQCVHG